MNNVINLKKDENFNADELIAKGESFLVSCKLIGREGETLFSSDANGKLSVFLNGYTVIPNEQFKAKQAEIADLKRQLHEHDDQIKNIETLNDLISAMQDKRINKLINEDAGLRAEAELSGAVAFKEFMLEVSTEILHPHIEGVFSVYKLRASKNET